MRFYLVPKIGDGLLPETAFRPKYGDPDSLGAGWLGRAVWEWEDYAGENAFLVAANLSPADHTTLTAQPDVIAVPSPIDDTVSSTAIATIKSRLEGANIPANWVTTAHTYRQVLKTVRKVMLLRNRYDVLFSRLPMFGGGVTLDTQINQLTQAQRNRLTAVAQDLNLDTSGVTNTMTLRQALKLIADQLADLPFGGGSF
jgi:hypothetical protein